MKTGGTTKKKASKQEKKQIVGYVRVSTLTQKHGREAQEAEIKRYAKDKGFEIVEIITEVESGKKNNRAGLNRAILLAQEKGVSLVVAKLDRLSRDIRFIFTLRDAGIDFVALDLPSFNTLTLGIFATIAQYERELTSERTKAGLVIAKKKGRNVGGLRTCADGETNISKARRRAILNRRAEALKNNIQANKIIKVLRDDGLSYQATATKLNTMDVTTLTGKTWTGAGVRKVVKLYEREGTK